MNRMWEIREGYDSDRKYGMRSAEDKAYEREFKAFNGVNQIDKKIIITMDDIDYSTSNVQHIKFKDFLFLENLK